MAKSSGKVGSGKGRPGKAKKAAGKQSRRNPGTEPDPGSGVQPTQALGSTTTAFPAGQRLWDMPYSSAPPRMIDPAIGLHNLVARAGHNAGYDIDLTLLDAPDHRLIRSGVLLAHRILDGRGEWYLGAPDWAPLLPKERIDPMSQGDLPEELADLIRPFRRRATLGPVAALRCERREFALRDDTGTTMALLRDDKVTVRRGGLTTARYREVMMTPVGAGLTVEQDAFLCQVLGDAGATPMERLPRLVNRLGAPANGPTDFPVPPPIDLDGPFATLVSSLLLGRLRELLVGDLRVRGDDPDGMADLGSAAADLRRILSGLAPMLDDAWLVDLDDELGWLVGETGQGQSAAANGSPEPRSARALTELKAKLRGERYMTMLERLVNVARTPKVRRDAARPAREALATLLGLGERRVGSTVDRLGDDSSTEAWEAARLALDDVMRLYDVIELVEPGRFDQLRAELAQASDLLTECGRHEQIAQGLRDSAADAEPAAAFELGRRYERQMLENRAARDAFVREWAKLRKHNGGNGHGGGHGNGGHGNGNGHGNGGRGHGHRPLDGHGP